MLSFAFGRKLENFRNVSDAYHRSNDSISFAAHTTLLASTKPLERSQSSWCKQIARLCHRSVSDGSIRVDRSDIGSIRIDPIDPTPQDRSISRIGGSIRQPSSALDAVVVSAVRRACCASEPWSEHVEKLVEPAVGLALAAGVRLPDSTFDSGKWSSLCQLWGQLCGA